MSMMRPPPLVVDALLALRPTIASVLGIRPACWPQQQPGLDVHAERLVTGAPHAFVRMRSVETN
jgi:hypothetical protein